MIFSRKEEKIDLHIVNPLAVKEEMKKAFPKFMIKYGSITDIYKVNNKRYKHEIWYYPKSKSRIRSERLISYEQIIVLIILMGLILSAIIFEQKIPRLQGKNSGIYMLIFIGVYGLYNLILYFI